MPYGGAFMSDSENKDQLKEQIDALESKVSRLEKTLYDVTVYLQKQASSNQPVTPLSTTTPVAKKTPVSQTHIGSPTPADTPKIAVTKPASEAKASFEIPAYLKKSEFWLNKVGIGLILFSIVFAFKYSIDQGWLTPPIRIAFGLLVGTILCGVGSKLYRMRRHFALVLLGGGIGAYYISGFAAFQLFGLISHPTAFGFMILVTLFSYVVSLRQNEPILSIIGTIGGLGTPFLLYTGQGNIPGLIIYTCIIIACSCGIYFFKGWRSILMITVIGGWIVFLVTQVKGLPYPKTEAISDRWAIQFGLIFIWLAYWLIPLLREALSQLKPDNWAYPSLMLGGKSVSPDLQTAIHRYVHILSVSTPIIVLAMSVTIWNFTDTTWGWVTMAASAVYGVVTFLTHLYKIRSGLSYTNALIGLMLFTISLSLVLDGATALISIAVEALIVFLIARKQQDSVISAFSHLLFIILAIMVLSRIYLVYMMGSPSVELFNKETLSDVIALGSIFAVGYLSTATTVGRLYVITGFTLLAGVLCRELNGNELFLALTIESVIIQAYLYYRDDFVFSKYGLVFGLLVSAWLLERLTVNHLMGTPFINSQSIIDMAFIGTTLGAAIINRKYSLEKIIFAILAHVGVLLWIYRELAELPNHQGIVSACWGGIAIILLVIGLRKNMHKVRVTALLTLLLVIAKLFLIDLGRIDAIWRVLLFLVLGGLLLLLSYYFKSLWKNDEPSESEVIEETSDG